MYRLGRRPLLLRGRGAYEQLPFPQITRPYDLRGDLVRLAGIVAGTRDSDKAEKRFIHKDRSEAWVLLSVSPVRSEEGKVIRHVARVRDVGARRRAGEELPEKNVLLERATGFESRFLADMGHEIRTPLTSMLGLTESLTAAELTSDERPSRSYSGTRSAYSSPFSGNCS